MMSSIAAILKRVFPPPIQILHCVYLPHALRFSKCIVELLRGGHFRDERLPLRSFFHVGFASDKRLQDVVVTAATYALMVSYSTGVHALWDSYVSLHHFSYLSHFLHYSLSLRSRSSSSRVRLIVTFLSLRPSCLFVYQFFHFFAPTATRSVVDPCRPGVIYLSVTLAVVVMGQLSSIYFALPPLFCVVMLILVPD